MFLYEVGIKENKKIYATKNEIAETPGKAKYQYYLDMQDIWNSNFGEIVKKLTCKKIGIAKIEHLYGDKEQFQQMCRYRGLSNFAYQGMRVEVYGKKGILVGGNQSVNLDVVFDGNWFQTNCHPWCNVKYFDTEGNLVKAY